MTPEHTIDLAAQADALQAENERLTGHLKALQAADTQAEIEKARRLSEHAQRRTRELNEDAARSQKRGDWNERQVQRCCAAVGVSNPSKVPAAIADMREAVEADVRLAQKRAVGMLAGGNLE